ncbi:MAG: hypothetical protein OXF02_05875 [Simkaniaceae bacterium]|nr:hypothetical protein [Simkaniaceae bacterium]
MSCLCCCCWSSARPEVVKGKGKGNGDVVVVPPEVAGRGIRECNGGEKSSDSAPGSRQSWWQGVNAREGVMLWSAVEPGAPCNPGAALWSTAERSVLHDPGARA